VCSKRRQKLALRHNEATVHDLWFEFLRKTVVAIAFAALALAETSAKERNFKLTVEAIEPTRFYLDDSNGQLWAPDGAIRYARGDEKHFVVKGGFEMPLLAGAYTLIAERGLEYRPFRATIEARAGEERKIHVVMNRWIDMNRLGWYSGDLHNHRRPEDMPVLLLAEDLNLAPTLADSIWENGQNSSPPKNHRCHPAGGCDACLQRPR